MSSCSPLYHDSTYLPHAIIYFFFYYLLTLVDVFNKYLFDKGLSRPFGTHLKQNMQYVNIYEQMCIMSFQVQFN